MTKRSAGIAPPRFPIILLTALLSGLCPLRAGAAPAKVMQRAAGHYFMPGPAESRIVTVSITGKAENEIVVMTEAIAVKEAGPRQALAKFGEVYAFAPSFVAVRENRPVRLTFWNLQPDDDHDFMLAGPDSKVLMYVDLKPLSRNSWVFTFHRPGLYSFYCAIHQPEMSGQILVLPAGGKP
jgi:plastocyanin